MNMRWPKIALLLAWGLTSPWIATAQDQATTESPKLAATPSSKPKASTEKPTASVDKKSAAKAKAAPKTSEPSRDELAIRRNVYAYIIAFESQNAEKLASMWAPNAVWVDGQTGDRVKGREAIQEQFANNFSEAEPARLKVDIQSIHFTTPTVAIEDGTATVVRPGEEPHITSYTAVHVLLDGRWYIDSIRETDLPPAPTATDQLSQLAWLEGTWVDESEESTVITKYHWTPNQTFLVQSFSAFIGEEVNMQGTQIIGWDPAQGRIRSWMFDSEGGFSEGNWESDGDRWVVRQSSTLPDGRHGSAINVITRLDNEAFTWKSSARQIDGELQPNIEAFTVTRHHDEVANISEEE